MIGWATKLTVYLLRRRDLTVRERTLLTGVLLDKLVALPASAILSTDESGQLLLYGRPLAIEQIKQLRESAKVVLLSSARKAVREQVAFMAVQLGVHHGDTPEKVLFSKAALWQGQEEDKLYEMLAGNVEELTL